MITNQLFLFIASVVVAITISPWTTDAQQHGNTSLVGTGNKDCKSRYDCKWSEACYNEKCYERCETHEGCGSNAYCFKYGGQKTCFCEDGYTGDPHKHCAQMCTVPWDCRSQEETCRNGLCSRECDVTACVTNGTCTVKNNFNHCMCPPGTTGNPYNDCKKICDSDNDCEDSEQCTKYKQCVRSCEPGMCGSNAVCNIENRRSICTCPEGYTGNPRRNCEKICANHDDCDFSEQCHDNKCSKKCHVVPSGSNSLCHIVEHACFCTCPEGYEGNPYIKCEKNCRFSDECGEGFSCHRGKCYENCHCGSGAACKMVDGKSECFCPPGTTGLAYGGCSSMCNTDEDCPDSEECDPNHRCIPACQEFSCASHAVCHVTNHRRTCDCPPQLKNDPRYNCKKTCKGREDSEVTESCESYKDGSPWKRYE